MIDKRIVLEYGESVLVDVYQERTKYPEGRVFKMLGINSKGREIMYVCNYESIPIRVLSLFKRLYSFKLIDFTCHPHLDQ